MRLLAVLILVLAVVPCFAVESIADSGNAFVRECSVVDKPSEEDTLSENISVLVCLSYVGGLADGTEVSAAWSGDKHPICLPSRGIEPGQMIRILLKYIHDNPAEAHLETRVLYVRAMSDAFPCSKQEK